MGGVVVRRIVVLGVLVVLVVVFSGCSCLNPFAGKKESYTATASWYGPGYYGKPTASGEVFKKNRSTCAHKTYLFGTRLKLIHLKNGRSVVVRVNDRGPFVPGRELDLSFKAAKKLDMLDEGVADVKVIVLERP